ncbi:barrier-to-autointegration factor-like [Folsomia candida]|uniref:barrier-to-autointegration factor-like n=1 Tax=Folsomia candida TaxID=158441 RepID=UPI000B8FC43C|nr:barrier-to-autointegration factor-like [Folsomia candida]XP_021951268.1 barrier-to-autointegration factor-like [Folsomia candida]
MATTSQKHRNFVLESMAEKLVTDIAGIGEVYGRRLSSQGYDKASVVLGQFLLLKRDQELFIDWLKLTAGMSTTHATSCHQCMSDWCNAFL